MTAKRRQAVFRSRKAELSALNDHFAWEQTPEKYRGMTAERDEAVVRPIRIADANSNVG